MVCAACRGARRRGSPGRSPACRGRRRDSTRLRERAARLREGQAALQRTEHGALLALYAAEASLGRAKAEQARLEARSRTHSPGRRTSLRVARMPCGGRWPPPGSESRGRCATLYVYGETDPIAAVLGATSLDEALAAIDSLERAAAQNKRLAVEARVRVHRLDAAARELEARRARLERGAWRSRGRRAARLERAAGERRATVASIRARSARAAARATSCSRRRALPSRRRRS